MALKKNTSEHDSQNLLDFKHTRPWALSFKKHIIYIYLILTHTESDLNTLILMDM